MGFIENLQNAGKYADEQLHPHAYSTKFFDPTALNDQVALHTERNAPWHNHVSYLGSEKKLIATERGLEYKTNSIGLFEKIISAFVLLGVIGMWSLIFYYRSFVLDFIRGVVDDTDWSVLGVLKALGIVMAIIWIPLLYIRNSRTKTGKGFYVVDTAQGLLYKASQKDRYFAFSSLHAVQILARKGYGKKVAKEIFDVVLVKNDGERILMNSHSQAHEAREEAELFVKAINGIVLWDTTVLESELE